MLQLETCSGDLAVCEQALADIDLAGPRHRAELSAIGGGCDWQFDGCGAVGSWYEEKEHRHSCNFQQGLWLSSIEREILASVQKYVWGKSADSSSLLLSARRLSSSSSLFSLCVDSR